MRRTSIGRSYQWATVLAAALVVSEAIEAFQPALPRRDDEVWVNPGFQLGAATDLKEYLKSVSIVLVGRVTQIKPEFIDSGLLATKVVFEPIEFIKGRGLARQPLVEAWSPGGTYIKTPQARIPYRASEGTEQLEVGKTYLASITREATGRLYLAPIDATVLLEEDDALALSQPLGQWLSHIVAEAYKKRGKAQSRRNAFLGELREAAGPQ